MLHVLLLEDSLLCGLYPTQHGPLTCVYASTLCLLAEPPILSAWMLVGFWVLHRSVAPPPARAPAWEHPGAGGSARKQARCPLWTLCPSADGGCKNEVLVETPFLPPCDWWPEHVLAVLLPSLWPWAGTAPLGALSLIHSLGPCIICPVGGGGVGGACWPLAVPHNPRR